MRELSEENKALVRAGSRARSIAFRVATLVFAAGAAGGLFGIGLVIGWSDTNEGGIHRVHDIGFGVLYGVLLTVALVAMAWKPEEKPAAFFQVAAVALAGLIAGLVSADPSSSGARGRGRRCCRDPAGAPPGARGPFDPAPSRVPRSMGAFVLAASVPLVWFGLAMAGLQRTGSSFDPHVSMDHWANMAGVALGLVLAGLLAASRTNAGGG